jgi:hypothetical protein
VTKCYFITTINNVQTFRIRVPSGCRDCHLRPYDYGNCGCRFHFPRGKQVLFVLLSFSFYCCSYVRARNALISTSREGSRPTFSAPLGHKTLLYFCGRRMFTIELSPGVYVGEVPGVEIGSTFVDRRARRDRGVHRGLMQGIAAADREVPHPL